MALRPAVIWRSVGGLPGPSEVRLESVWQSSCPSEDILPARPPASLAQFRGARGCQTARAHWAALAACPRGGFAEAPAAQRSSVVVRKSSRRALRPSGPGAHFSRVQIAGADAASARIAARAGPGALRRWRVFPGRRTRPGIAPATRNRSFQTLPPRWITLQTPQPNRLRPCRRLCLPRAEGSPAPVVHNHGRGGDSASPGRCFRFEGASRLRPVCRHRCTANLKHKILNGRRLCLPPPERAPGEAPAPGDQSR